MATTIKLKNSVTTTNAPSSLEQGEVAINVTDKKVWVGNAATSPVQLLGVGGSASFTSVAFADGTAAAPSITNTGDTNTGIFFPAADTIAFTEGGVESMRIDSDGNVGIGTDSPLQKLQISTTGDADLGPISIALGGPTANARQALIEKETSGTRPLSIYSSQSDSFFEPIAFLTGSGAERVRITEDGDVGIGTDEPSRLLTLSAANPYIALVSTNTTGAPAVFFGDTDDDNAGRITYDNSDNSMAFSTVGAERMRITDDGYLLVGNSTNSSTDGGFYFISDGPHTHVRMVNESTTTTDANLYINRQASDGQLIAFRQANTLEGNISVSGSTVSYNGGHLARWSQLLDGSKDEALLKGTVLSNLDEMCVWEKDGVVAENEQLNKMKVSDVEGDTNVAGVFVNWTTDEDYNSDDMNIAMTGDMIIRIAEGVTVQRGDLLMSAGDGTAKPQGDDIVRSKTIAKVTSTNITCTYADGSYCVPCVLMAC
jgi:hypothetical protein